MKKYLMSGALALIAGLFVTSCHDDDVYENINVIDQKTQGFQKAFKEAFGTINPNKTWGFKQTDAATKTVTATSTSVRTRAAYPNSNMWEDEGYVIPADITQAEIDKVLAVFNQKGEEHYESLVDWDCFFVQQVWKGTASYTAGNGGTVIGGDQMDWLCAYNPVGKEETIYPDWNGWQATVVTNHDDHINNFNNASGSIMLMINSSTQRFGYKSSTDNGHVFYYFRMEYIDGAYYVGFDFSAEGQNPNEQVQRDYIYNDWIVKIVPGKGASDEITTQTRTDEDIDYQYSIEDEVVETGRILCEDLGNFSNREDLDYNDVVFNAQIVQRTYKTTTITTTITIEETYVNGVYQSEREIGRQVKSETTIDDSKNLARIELYAAGGTLELTVAGQEVHELFGVGVTTMVNTRDKNTPTVNGANTVVRKPVRMTNPNPKEIAALNPNPDSRSDAEKEKDKYLLYGDGKFNKILDIPIRVCYQEGQVLELKSNPGTAPHKILVDIDTRWPSERCAIDKAYPMFESYVNSNDVEDFWSDGGDDNYLYDKEATISTEAVGDVQETVTGQGNVTLNVLWKYEGDEEGYDISRGLYFTNRNIFNTLGIKAGDRLRIEGIKTDGDWAIFLSDGNSSLLHSDLTSLNTNEYAEVTLTENMVSQLINNNNNAAMIISGKNVRLTRVSLIKK